MKKIMLLTLSLSLLLLLPGCGGGGGGSVVMCPRGGFTPGATYNVFYTRPYYPPDRVLTKVADAAGNISVPKYDFPSCDLLQYAAVTNSNVTLSASPSSVYLPAPPTTTTVSGQLFSTTYGMPEVSYFDSNGYLVGSVYASSVTGGGTALQANMPNLNNVYSGSYQVRVTNKTSAGYYVHIVGSAPMTAWGRDRTDSDGDGWYDDEDCDPYDPSRNSNCTETCGGGGSPGHPYELPTICEY